MSNEKTNTQTNENHAERDLSAVLCSHFDWEERRPGEIVGWLKSDPGTALFLIEVNPEKPHRGRLFGAFMPDDQDGFEGLISGLKMLAPSYLNDWVNKFLSANDQADSSAVAD